MFQPRHSSTTARNKFNKVDLAPIGSEFTLSNPNHPSESHKAEPSVKPQQNAPLNLYSNISTSSNTLKLDKLPNLEQLRKSCIYDIDTLVFCLYGLELQRDGISQTLHASTPAAPGGTAGEKSPAKQPFRFVKVPEGKRPPHHPHKKDKQLVQFNFESALPSPSLLTAPSKLSTPPDIKPSQCTQPLPTPACATNGDGPLRGSEKAVRGPIPGLKPQTLPAQPDDEEKKDDEKEVSFLERVLGRDLEENEHISVPLGSIPPRAGVNELSWQYKDPSGGIQGPFTSRQMFEWWEKNFFPPKLLVRYSVNMPWTSYRVLYPEPVTPFLSPPNRYIVKASSTPEAPVDQRGAEALSIAKQMRVLLSSIEPTIESHNSPLGGVEPLASHRGGPSPDRQGSQVGWVAGKPKAEPLAEIMARQADEAGATCSAAQEPSLHLGHSRADGPGGVWGPHDKYATPRRTGSDPKCTWDAPRPNGMPLASWIREDRQNTPEVQTTAPVNGPVLELNRMLEEWQIKIDPCLLGILFSLKSEANILIFLKHAAKGSAERHAAFAAYLNKLRERYPAEWAQMMRETTLKSSKASFRSSGRARSSQPGLPSVARGEGVCAVQRADCNFI